MLQWDNLVVQAWHLSCRAGGSSSSHRPSAHLALSSLACPQVVWKGYLATMRALGFNRTTRLYAASGMLTYGASGGWRWVGG